MLEFDHGVAAYPPGESGGYWRIRWEESRRRRDTTAKSRSAAIAKATEIVERLARSTPTELGRAEAPTYVADAECRRLLTSVKTNSGTVQVRRPITLDGLTHIRCQRRVHERHRDMLDHATRDLRRVVSRAHRTRSRRSGALQVGAIPVSATCQPLQWSRSSAENSSPRARPPDYDESSARRDHQASAAVIALSASWMPSPTSPAVAAQCKGTRARAPGSQRCSSRVSGSGAVPS